SSAGRDAPDGREPGAAHHRDQALNLHFQESSIVMQDVVANFGMQAAAAEIFLLAAICVILLVDVFLSDSKRWITYGLSMLTLAGCAYVTVRYSVDGRVTAFDGTFVADPMGDVLKLFTYGTVAVSLLYSR